MESDNINLVDMEERIFDNQYFYKIEYYLNHNQFARVLAILPTIETEFIKIENRCSIFLRLYFNYSIAYAHFMSGGYVDSQKYLVKLMNHPELKSRNDYFAATHLLKLFVHFELGNFEHLSCELKNVRELLKRNHYLYEFEIEAIGMLKKLNMTNDKESKQKIYVHYHTIFEALFEQVEQKDAFEKFNILSWIDKKIKLYASQTPSNEESCVSEIENVL